MKPSIESLFNDFEKVKGEFISLVSSFSPEQLTYKPTGGWNMLQVLEHVISSENGTLEYMKRKTRAPWAEIEMAADEENQKSTQLNIALKSDKRWKAPDVLPNPTGAQSLENMLVYWDNLRLYYFDFLETLDENYHNRLIFNHPFSGRLNLYQTIEFLSNHVLHHIHQLKRIAEVVK